MVITMYYAMIITMATNQKSDWIIFQANGDETWGRSRSYLKLCQCVSMPINANQCQSMPFNANQCQSINQSSDQASKQSINPRHYMIYL